VSHPHFAKSLGVSFCFCTTQVISIQNPNLVSFFFIDRRRSRGVVRPLRWALDQMLLRVYVVAKILTYLKWKTLLSRITGSFEQSEKMEGRGGGEAQGVSDPKKKITGSCLYT
jgi:hypothetical protein